MAAKTGTAWRSRRVQIIVGVVVLVAIGAAAVAMTRAGGLGGGGDDVPTFEARRGPLTISVSESGAIQSRDQVILKCEVEGQTTIISLIPEGTRVEEGELLVELDASNLEDSQVNQEIAVQNARAEYIRARENLAVVKNQADSDISTAELNHEFAKEDLRKYLGEGGEYAQQLDEAESRITIADEELTRARKQLEWSEQLYTEKYISKTELDADKLALKRAELDYELAVTAKRLLEEYTHKRQVAQLESDVDQTGMALERAKLKANADIVQAEATLKAKEAELERQESKLEKIKQQLTKTKIYAPRAGLVVYATSAQSRGWRDEPLAEGQAVRERQEIIYLPSTSSMMAEIMVHESSLDKIDVGQFTRVTVDAVPGRVFAGSVRSIAPLPDARSSWMNPDLKLYQTQIDLDGSNPELRTGMSCQAEIIVQQLEDAVHVPTQAVVRHGGRATVFVKDDDEFVPREVVVGLDNNTMVHIKEGLEAGDVVSLLPPLEDGTNAGTNATAPTEPGGKQPAGADSGGAGVGGRSGGGRGQPGQGGTGPAAGPGAGGTGGGMPQLSEEQLKAMREKFEKMSPEEKQKAIEEMRKRFGGAGGDPGAGQPGGAAQPAAPDAGKPSAEDAKPQDAAENGAQQPAAPESDPQLEGERQPADEGSA